MKKGLLFERVVAAVELALATVPGTRIRHNVQLTDRDGITQQIDVLVQVPVSVGRTLSIAIECRDQKTPVKKEAIHAFKTKCDEAGVDRRVVVSARGFQRAAKSKAKSFQIELWELRDLERGDVRHRLFPPTMRLVLTVDTPVCVDLLVPDAPEGVVFHSSDSITDTVWSKRTTLGEFVQELHHVFPPLDKHFANDRKPTRLARFDAGEVTITSGGADYSLQAMLIQVERKTHTLLGSVAHSGSLASTENGVTRNTLQSFRFPTPGGDYLTTWVADAEGKPLRLVADCPADSTKGREIRAKRQREQFAALTPEVLHQEQPVESGASMKVPKDRGGLVTASFSYTKLPDAGSTIDLEQLFLTDRRTAFATTQFMVELLNKWPPPVRGSQPGTLRRFKSTYSFSDNSVHVSSTQGFLAVSAISLDVIYLL